MFSVLVSRREEQDEQMNRATVEAVEIDTVVGSGKARNWTFQPCMLSMGQSKSSANACCSQLFPSLQGVHGFFGHAGGHSSRRCQRANHLAYCFLLRAATEIRQIRLGHQDAELVYPGRVKPDQATAAGTGSVTGWKGRIGCHCFATNWTAIGPAFGVRDAALMAVSSECGLSFYRGVISAVWCYRWFLR